MPALIDLWVAAWTEARPSIDFEARRPWFRDHLAALLASGTLILAARRDDAIVCFATVHPTTGTLDQLVVALEHQGRGHAGALIDAAKRRAPGGLTLSVNADNAPALALYRRHGFALTGEGVNARSGLPILHMAWRPDGPPDGNP